MGTAATAPGLTTTKAPFIEECRGTGELFIRQPYELYSEDNQQAWRALYARIRPRWDRYAHPRFLQGVQNLALNPDRIPRLEEINQFLSPLSGFKAKAVSGYVPMYLFFDCLRNRDFPTTITIRDSSKLEYLPEPDIFHDVAGHVPMHTDRRFSDVLVRFGEVGHEAAMRAKDMKDHDKRLHTIESVMKAMARFFWFTIEFGLMRDGKDIKVSGSGLLSSYGEIAHCIESPDVQRYPLQLEWVVNQGFEIHHYQPLLFVADGFDQLFEMVEELGRWARAGKLDNVAPGEPGINDAEMESFLAAEA
ncbi:MAG: phenylalanine 4-monooxygenase [Candidatus Sumerlaeia bacterium]|nr:phenylalanine 4-monooxygenase [Candidatus Sumerlaeia bacterium]